MIVIVSAPQCWLYPTVLQLQYRIFDILQSAVGWELMSSWLIKKLKSLRFAGAVLGVEAGGGGPAATPISANTSHTHSISTPPTPQYTHPLTCK